jgi:hypothetical protein
MVRVEPNPARRQLAPPGLTPDQMETILYEARTGRVPVRGAGFRGRFGGPGWDGMWLDMSEIVRPTRDGIHGRETISTTVEIGGRPATLAFDADGRPLGHPPRLVWVEVPFILDGTGVPDTAPVASILAETARRIDSLALLRADQVAPGMPGERVALRLSDRAVVPPDLTAASPLVELDASDLDPEKGGAAQAAAAATRFPRAVLAWRVPLGANLEDLVRAGAGVLHLVADEAQRLDPALPELLRDAHQRLVDAGLRDRVTLIGSVGACQAEHAAKAIACGLDLVALDLPLWVALQAELAGPEPRFGELDAEWGVGRLQNLVASWRDQLLEVLGAMGLREVRRLRGELGRTIFQAEMEREAFGGVEGFPVSEPEVAGA